MKVLHLYSGNLFGGIETLLLTLAREQKSFPQMQHHFALCFEGRLTKELQTLSAKIHHLGNVRISRPWLVWQARQQLKQLLKQEQFDIVISHACWVQAIFGSVVRAHHLPLVFWCHDILKGKHPIERLAKLVLPDVVIANSHYTESSIKNIYPHSNSTTIYLPVASPNIEDEKLVRHTVREELNTPEESIVIIQASRLEKWKGQSMLIATLGQLRHVPNWVCWIAGGVQRANEEEYLQELKKQTQELGIAERIFFLGQRTDIKYLLAAADIHCQPNTSPEPFGITFIEALYAGLPVVTTAIGAALEIVDDSCGRLVPVNDVSALSGVLSTLITHPSQRLALASHGKIRANDLCNPQKQLNQLYNLLCDVIEQYDFP